MEYTGEYRDNRREGKGVGLYKTKEKYIGDYKQDNRDGKVKII